MKKLVYLIMTGTLAVACCGGAPEVNPRSYTAFRAAEISLDGVLDDACWQAAKPSEPFVDISTDVVPLKETTVKMLWDDDYLYIGATIQEDKIVANLKQRDTIIWKENDFEVFIDPDGDRQSYFEIEINAIGTIMDLMMNKPYSEGGNFYMPWDCPGLIVTTSCDDAAWYAELAVPRKSVMVGFTEPDVLKSWRINFSRVEWLNPTKEENWVWNPTGKIDMHMPELWGVVYFDSADVLSLK